MRVRGQRNGEFEGAVAFLLAVFSYETIQRPLQKPGGLRVGPFPIGRVCNAEFDQDAGKTRRRCIAAE